MDDDDEEELSLLEFAALVMLACADIIVGLAWIVLGVVF